MSQPADPSRDRSSAGHLVSVVATGVDSHGVIVEWVVECYTEGCAFQAGPSGDVAMLRQMRDRHLNETRG